MRHRLVAAVVTDAGNIRDTNEDNFLLSNVKRRSLESKNESAVFRGADNKKVFAVADGMGGLTQGELASRITVDCLQGCSFSKIQKTADESIRQANQKICAEAGKVNGRRMGSTLVALYMDGGKAISCNIGDSRAYLLRKDELIQLSVDHSRERLLVSLGIVSAEDARASKKSHVLTQNLGTPEDELYLIPAYSSPIKVTKGDRFLLCSDGLTDMLSDAQILQTIRSGSAVETAQRLLNLALEHGGRDNVTVMIVDVGGFCL